MRNCLVLLVMFLMTACNSVYLKPNTLDTTDVIYVERGGYQLQHAIKKYMENRGYNVTVGKKKTTYIASNDEDSVLSLSDIGRARYVVQINEKVPTFHPVWCVFNGFWWWRFNISIADNRTGREILGWAGRGCQDSSLRKLDNILDELELKDE